MKPCPECAEPRSLRKPKLLVGHWLLCRMTTAYYKHFFKDGDVGHGCLNPEDVDEIGYVMLLGIFGRKP